MAINKVTKNGQILIDLSQDTVASAGDIVAGKVGHLQDGTQVTGTAQPKTLQPSKSYTATAMVILPSTMTVITMAWSRYL